MKTKTKLLIMLLEMLIHLFETRIIDLTEKDNNIIDIKDKIIDNDN